MDGCGCGCNRFRHMHTYMHMHMHTHTYTWESGEDMAIGWIGGIDLVLAFFFFFFSGFLARYNQVQT